MVLPSWAKAKLNAQLMANYSVNAAIMDLLGRDAMTMLWEWVNRPDPEAWANFSELVPLMLMAQRPEPSDADAMYAHAAALSQGAKPSLPAGTVTAWTHSSGSLGFAAAGSPKSLSTIAVGLCLDDRAASGRIALTRGVLARVAEALQPPGFQADRTDDRVRDVHCERRRIGR